MANKKILITGATGFIGGHILKKLNVLGYECVAVIRKSNRELESILCKKNIFEGNTEEIIKDSSIFNDISAVIHCAS